jgi:anti-sigma regulatory factor (Ser/Thr protein kinase)
MKIDTRSFPARVENLAVATEFVEACADRATLDPKVRFGLQLALEEAFVNVCSYAYPGGVGAVEVTCSSGEQEFVLDIVDRGVPFDSLALPEPDTTAGIMDRRVGGLGIHFIRNLTQNVTYRREDDRNVLSLVFKAGVQ